MGIIRPDASSTLGGTWTASGAATLHAAVNETNASDAEFAYGSDGGGNTVRFDFATPGGNGPASSGTCTARIRLAEIDTGVLAGTFNGNANPLTVTVSDSGGQIAQTTFSPTTWQTFTTLTFNASAVTDWSSIFVTVADTNHGGPGGNRRGGGVSWLEIEYPDAGTPITVNQATHSHSAEQPTIASKASLTINDATSAHAAEQPTVTFTSIQIVVNGSTHGHSAEQAPIGIAKLKVYWAAIILPEEQGVTAIVPADATHGHTAEQPTITVQGTVSVNSATHAHSSESPTVSTNSVVAPTDSTHGHSAASPTVVSSGTLSINDATHGHSSEQPSLSTAYTVAPVDALHTHAAEQPTITPKTVQRIRADADVTDAAWLASTGLDLYAMVDEATASDADYIYTGTDNSVCEISLGAANDPGIDTDHSFYVRMKGDGTRDLRITLKQGITTIARWTEVDPPTVETTFRYDLTPAEAANITDYTALSVQLEALP